MDPATGAIWENPPAADEQPAYPTRIEDNPEAPPPAPTHFRRSPNITPETSASTETPAATAETNPVTRPLATGDRMTYGDLVTAGAIDPAKAPESEYNTRYEDGRPQDTTGPDALERDKILAENVRNFIPQKQKGWRKWLPIVAGLAGGVGGAIAHDSRSSAQGFYNSFRRIANPKVADEDWKASKQAEVAKQTDQDLDTAKAQAQITDYQAQAIQRLRKPVHRKQIVVDKKTGLYRSIDAETGLDESGKPVQGEVQKVTAGFKGWVHDADGKAHYYDNGQDTGRLDPGRDKVKLPDGRLVDSSQSYGAELAAGREDRGIERQNEQNRIENEQTQAAIAAAQKELDQIKTSLRDKTYPPTVKRYVTDASNVARLQDVPNPDYTNLMGRERDLDDKIRELGTKIKPIVITTPASSQTGGKTPPGGKKFHVDPKFDPKSIQ